MRGATGRWFSNYIIKRVLTISKSMLTTTENKFRKHDLIFVNILTIKHKNLRVDCRGW